jgi:hypothetical protein
MRALSRRDFVASSAAILTAALSARAWESRGVDSGPASMMSADDLWKSLEQMAQLGPRHTGSDAHRKFVDLLAARMQDAGLQVGRDTYTLPRWDARRWGLKAAPKSGAAVEIPVASYYPYSGQTGRDGVTGALVYAGAVPSDGSRPPDLSDVNGKIVVIDYPIAARHYEEWFKPWGFHASDTTLGPVVTSIIAVAAPQLADFKKAGARGVVFAFTNISDGHAAGQYLPFGRALQEMPTLWVGRDAGVRLRKLAQEGASATLTLDADVFPGTHTDTVFATLPGASTDEAIIVNTHTDGPNAIEENGGVALVALAKYFAKIPRGSRKRTLVFVMTTGHFAGAYVPTIRGFIEQHQDVIKKTVAAVTVEHLGCREWLDDASMKYAATGKDEISNAITDSQGIARLTLESLQGTADRRVAVVKPTPKGRWMGEGGSLSRAGVPTLGYIPAPTYLCMMAPDGCLSRLSKSLFHAQTRALATLINKLDAAPAASLENT